MILCVCNITALDCSNLKRCCQQLTEEEMIEQRLKNAKPVPVTECLFDGHVSNDLQSNLDYTRSKFSFFIPEIENLVDLEGFMTYLGEKVGVGYTCLYCGKDYQSLPAVRSHMVDKSHCKLKFYEELEEYDEYYNFEESAEDENTNRSLITVNDDGSVDTGYATPPSLPALIFSLGRRAPPLLTIVSFFYNTASPSPTPVRSWCFTTDGYSATERTRPTTGSDTDRRSRARRC